MQDISRLPKPTDDSVDLRNQSGGCYACVSFSGIAGARGLSWNCCRVHDWSEIKLIPWNV